MGSLLLGERKGEGDKQKHDHSCDHEHDHGHGDHAGAAAGARSGDELSTAEDTAGDTDAGETEFAFLRGSEEKEKEKENSGEGGCLGNSPLLNKVDESTTTPGLFLVGPAMRHGDPVFCFVYKFRQRLAVVADAIARRLGHDTEFAVSECRKKNMFLDDFTCCKGACGEAC